jgi:hypothetical protein
MTKHRYNIAMLLATRGRTTSLDRSIRSLVELADDPKKLQLMFAFDKDDEIGTTFFKETLQPWLDSQSVTYVAMRFDRLGYVNLHKYNNALAKMSNSEWLMIWNDDAVMQTQGWDSVIMSYTNEHLKLLGFCTHNMHPYSIFPTIPRAWFDLLGYISPHSTQDGWVSQQAYLLDIYHRIPVDVLHDRFDLTGNNGDATFLDRHILEGKPLDPNDFHSLPNLQIRQGDCAKLAMYMQEHGQSTEYFENVFKGTQEPWQRLLENDPNNQMKQFSNPHFGKSANAEPIST